MVKTLQTFSRTESDIDNVALNVAFELDDLFYSKIKNASCAYTRIRRHVNRTIGPLVSRFESCILLTIVFPSLIPICVGSFSSDVAY